MQQTKRHELLYHDGHGVLRFRRTASEIHPLGRLLLVLFCAISLAVPSQAFGADLKEDTLKAWDNYVQATRTEMPGQGASSSLN